MSLSSRSTQPNALKVIPGKKKSIRLMLVSGEASGDEHGSAVVREVLARVPDAEIFGMGGRHLRNAGMEIVVDAEASGAVMGFTEVFGSARKILQARKRLLREAQLRRPDIVVLIDFPDFNLSLARTLKRNRVSILYFITPQLWAWRKKRIRKIQKLVRKVAPIFPFEESFFQQHGVDAEYVGHPFLDRPALETSREAFLHSVGVDDREAIVALLPGSRKAEANLLFEPMLEAFFKLRAVRPNLRALVPIAPALSRSWFEDKLRGREGVTLVDGRAREILQFARVAVVASGTASVEAALSEIPFVVVYRLSPTSFRIAKWLVKGVRHFAMPNLIVGEKVVPELLQDEVSAENIAKELELILGDPAKEAKMKKEIALVGERLRFGRQAGTSTAGRTAELVIELAEERSGTGKKPWRTKRAHD